MFFKMLYDLYFIKAKKLVLEINNLETIHILPRKTNVKSSLEVKMSAQNLQADSVKLVHPYSTYKLRLIFQNTRHV